MDFKIVIRKLIYFAESRKIFFLLLVLLFLDINIISYLLKAENIKFFNFWIYQYKGFSHFSTKIPIYFQVFLYIFYFLILFISFNAILCTIKQINLRFFIHIFWILSLVNYIFLNPYSNIYKVPLPFSFKIENTKISLTDFYIENNLPFLVINNKKLSINKPIKLNNFVIYLYSIEPNYISLKIQKINFLVYATFLFSIVAFLLTLFQFFKLLFLTKEK